MKNLLVLSAFFCIIFSGILNAGWRPGEMLVEIPNVTPADQQKVAAEKLSFDQRGAERLEVYVTPAELERLQQLGLNPRVLIPSLEAHSEELLNNPDFANYHDYFATKNLVDSLLAAYPNLISKKIYGYSLQGREVYAVKISDNVQVDEPEPEISLDGNHHGDEIMGAEILVLLMRDLCKKYGTDPQITNLVNNREIWIMPIFNPDGRQAMVRYNNAGVDLNRDWGYMWDGWGNSPAPFSQPETQAGRAWINEHQFVISQSDHGGAEQISYPWSYRPDASEDDAPIDFVAGGYSSHSGYSYLPYDQGYSSMYAINGSAKDSFYGLMGSVGWTLEVSNDKTPPSSQIPLYYNYNKPAMLYLIDMASRGIKGMVTDATNGNPVAAIAWVKDAGHDYWPIYGDPAVGDFHKFVLPGTYSVTITANGYQPQTITNVTVVDTGATGLNVQLQPQLGTYAYRVIYSQIPNNNHSDEGYTPGALGAPDNVNYSLGKNGYIVLDMGEQIDDFPGNDLRVVEGDVSPEGYTVKVSDGWNGPWTSLGMGTGTSDFDLAGVTPHFRYIRIEDDGDGPSTGADIGFDLDAVEGRLIPSSGPFVMAASYTVNDSAGNANGVFEAGETVELSLLLQNLGVDPAQNVRVLISSNDPRLTVLSDSAWFGDMSAGQSGMVGPYQVSVDPATPHNTKLNLTVDIRADNGYQWTHPLPLTIRQGARIATNPASIQFDSTFINFTSTWPLKISNNGADSLFVHQLQTGTPLFWVNQPSLAIAPGANLTIDVYFQPPDTFTYTDTLTLANSDPVNFVWQVPLSGRGILAPDIALSSDSISVQLLPTDSLVVPLTIQNTGAGPLSFTAQIGNYQPTEGAGGNDSFGHIWIDSDEPGGPAYSWVELGNGAGTPINISGLNAISNTIQIGFSVPFYNNTFSSLRVCTNGWISFTTYSVSYNNTPLPSTMAPRAMIAPLWDNLYFQNDSRAWYLQESNRFIVEWENVYTATGFGPYTFELIIYDNGNLMLQYKTLTNLEDAYTVGMQDNAATDGFHIAFNEPYLHEQLAVLINRRSWVSLNPMGGTVAPGGQTTLDVKFKTENFPLGHFWASVDIYSNDPDEGIVTVPIHLVVDTTQVGIANLPSGVPRMYRLEQNYPNPFNPSTLLRFQLPRSEKVLLEIYNIRGQKIRTLVDGSREAGFHQANWDSRNDHGEQVASGFYFYRLQAGDFQAMRRMLLLK